MMKVVAAQTVSEVFVQPKNLSTELFEKIKKNHSPSLRWDNGESDVVSPRWCLSDKREGGDEDGTVNKNTRWNQLKMEGGRREERGKSTMRVKDKGQLESGGWKGLFNEGWKGASHGWRDGREREEEKREGGTAENLVLCNSDFFVGSDVK